MERATNLYGQRLDDALKEEVEPLLRATEESRVEEDRESEPSGEDQPEVQEILHDESGWQGQPINAGDVRQRSEIARHLQPSLFPAGREQLVDGARDNGAPDWVIEALQRLREGAVFRNVEDLWRALGGPEETRV